MANGIQAKKFRVLYIALNVWLAIYILDIIFTSVLICNEAGKTIILSQDTATALSYSFDFLLAMCHIAVITVVSGLVHVSEQFRKCKLWLFGAVFVYGSGFISMMIPYMMSSDFLGEIGSIPDSVITVALKVIKLFSYVVTAFNMLCVFAAETHIVSGLMETYNKCGGMPERVDSMNRLRKAVAITGTVRLAAFLMFTLCIPFANSGKLTLIGKMPVSETVIAVMSVLLFISMAVSAALACIYVFIKYKISLATRETYKTIQALSE